MEDILKQLNKVNPGKNIISALDPSFKRYGAIHRGFKINKLLDYLSQTKVADEVAYIRHKKEIKEKFSDQLDPIINSIYAGMDVQVGHCYGRNNKLNALEYHQGSEVYINATDMILLLGLSEDIDWPSGTFESSKIRAFYAPRGLVIELKGGCMHYAAVNVFYEEGINLIVCLLDKTNTPVDFNIRKHCGDNLIIAKNTWFLAHPEYEPAKEEKRHLGIKGENLSFITLDPMI